MSSGRQSGWKWGCGGCGLLALIAWALLWGFIAIQLRQSKALEKVVRATGPEVTLVRVPGGVARRLEVGGFMFIHEVSWSRDGRYLLYAGSPEMDLGKIMGLGMSSNPFQMEKNTERMQREVMKLVAPRLHLYDQRTGKVQELRGDWPATLSPTGDARLSPDNRHLALELAEFTDPEAVADAKPEVYVASLGPEGRLTGLRRLASGSLVSWLPDSKRVLFQQPDGDQKGTYIIAVAGGKPRRVAKELLGFRIRGMSRDGRYAYARTSTEKANALGGKFSLVRLDLQTGRRHDIPVRAGPARLGPLGPWEMVLWVKRGRASGPGSPKVEADSTSMRGDVGALDMRTGQARWIRKGLVGVWTRDRQLLLDGRVIALSAAPGMDEKTKDDDAELSLSALDGRVRRRAALLLPDRPPDDRWLSPDGRQMAFTARPAQLRGLNPLSLARQTIWLADLNRPEDLLTGPGE